METVISLGVFFVVMVGIGIWGMKKTKTLNDFYLGGRDIGLWMSAFAYGTTYFSAVLFVGFAGQLGWKFGLNALWIALGNAVGGSLLAWLVLGGRTRRMTQNLNAMTMPEFFHERFDASYLKIIAAIIIFIFLTPYTASVFKGLGNLFGERFGISYESALLWMTLITGVYLVLGGYFAVNLTDFVQGIIMLGGSLVMVWMLVGKFGGSEHVIANISAKYAEHVPPAKQPDFWTVASLVFMTSFGTWGMPQMVQKFYAIKNDRIIVKAAIATTVFALIIAGAAYFTGSMTHLSFETVPVIAGTQKPDFDLMIPQMLTTNLPAWLLALIILLILSASMSTLSSLVLVAAGAISIDLYKGHINPAVPKEKSLLMIRAMSAVFVVISWLIATYKIAFIVTLMSLSWGVVAGAFMAPFIYGLYWKRTTALSVLASMVTALLVTGGSMLWLVLKFADGMATYQMYSTKISCVAMLLPFVIVPVVSLLTKAPEKAVIDKAFGGAAATVHEKEAVAA
ncbi:MAG TPA: sodium/solute symporter [Planctomycetota bacterium]|jgi:SSS family solute:Na+ symporter